MSDTDQGLAELFQKNLDLKLRQVTESVTCAGTIMCTGQHNMSFRRWLEQWLRQLHKRCPGSTLPPLCSVSVGYQPAC